MIPKLDLEAAKKTVQKQDEDIEKQKEQTKIEEMLYRIIDKLDEIDESEETSNASAKSLEKVIDLVEKEVKYYIKKENNAVSALL